MAEEFERLLDETAEAQVVAADLYVQCLRARPDEMRKPSVDRLLRERRMSIRDWRPAPPAEREDSD